MLRDGRELLSDVVYSQVALHHPYGGVVPELASRRHLDKIVPVAEEALSRAGVSIQGYRGSGGNPGTRTGRRPADRFEFCQVRQRRLTGAPGGGQPPGRPYLLHFFGAEVGFPFLSLTVSGGHTSLYRVSGIGSYGLLGQTRDDAAGEAFDKVAKLLNLGYPGGKVIEDLALQGHPSIRFPRAIPGRDSLDFSFSGIKTAVVNFVKRFSEDAAEPRDLPLADIAASFQEAVVDMLIKKVTQARQQSNYSSAGPFRRGGGQWVSPAAVSVPGPGRRLGPVYPFSPILHR